jgi:hypothetical protein
VPRKTHGGIDRNRAVELLRCDLVELVALVVGSVVDQHRSGTECGADLAERRAQRRGVGEVAGHEEWTCHALDERIGEGGAGFALQVEKRDLGIVLDKGADKGRANAAGAPGNDHRSAFE